MKNKRKMEVINKRHKLRSERQRLSACQKKEDKSYKKNQSKKQKLNEKQKLNGAQK